MKKKPEVIQLNDEELKPLMQRVKEALSEEDANIIIGIIETLIFIIGKLEQKNVQVKALLKQIFGIKSEKTKKIVKQNNEKGTEEGASENKDGKITDQQDSSEEKDSESDSSLNQQNENQNSRPRKKGHGRNGADAYTGGKIIHVPLENINNGDPCIKCLKGKLYKIKIPGVFIYIKGEPPINADIYKIEKYRCNLCGAIYKAKLPNNLPDDPNVRRHYDESAKTVIVLLRYGYGFPVIRLEKFQKNVGIPLPASTQWDKIEEVADTIYPVFEELKRTAAQGKIVYNDDTTNKVLTLMEEIEKEKQTGEKGRTGIFTSGIISIVDDHQIALYFTGRQHAGENANDLFKSREKDRSPPIYMNDAKKGNTPKDTEVIECNCNVHARRYFVKLVDDFPEECEYVIVDVFSKIYENERITQKHEMSPDERLKFHKENSKPIMDDFFEWLNEKKDNDLVEPNSSLGKAISYTLNHWDNLTRFLHVEDAPLDNNICERAIKIAIFHRKNSLFFKNEHGAYIGDMFMSLIHTCSLNDINVFYYLTEIQKHKSELFKNSEKFLPWNYQATIEQLNLETKN